jgi:hypothetical protein
MFDLTYKVSFDNLTPWKEDIKRNCYEHTCIVLVGTKADLVDKRKVTVEEAKEFAEQHQISYFETSAKTNKNLSEAVLYLAHEIYEMYVLWMILLLTLIRRKQHGLLDYKPVVKAPVAVEKPKQKDTMDCNIT